MIVNKRDCYDSLLRLGANFEYGTKVEQSLMFRGPVATKTSCTLKQSKIDAFSTINMNSNCIRADIGRYCAIGDNVIIGDDANVSLKDQGFSISQAFTSTDTFKFAGFPSQSFMPNCPRSKEQEPVVVKLGHDVWVGSFVTIAESVTIGTGAIILANAVINQDIHPFAIVSGKNKIEGQRFSDEVCADLMALQWWNYNLPEMQKHGLVLDIQDTPNFIAKFKDLAPERLITFKPEWTLLVAPDNAINENQYFTTKVNEYFCPYRLSVRAG